MSAVEYCGAGYRPLSEYQTKYVAVEVLKSVDLKRSSDSLVLDRYSQLEIPESLAETRQIIGRVEVPSNVDVALGPAFCRMQDLLPA